MILRKPYAFFIKFFKTFHLIMFLFGSILLYRTSLIYNFFKEFNLSNSNVIGKDLVSPLFSWWMFLILFVLIVINIIMIVVLIRKDKPFIFYVFNIFIYSFALIMYFYSRSIVSSLEVMLVSAKTTLAVRDIMNILRLVQTVSIVFYLIRATGFDIRKFDFVHDLQKLDISIEDNEEYEVAVSFESNVFFRNFNKFLRDFKYYYKENKFLINISFLLFFSFILLFIYYSTNKYNKIYSENDFFNVSGYTIGVKNTYIVEKDYKGSKLFNDDSVLVVVNSSMRGNDISVSANRVVLVIGSSQYYHSYGYSSYISDLGNVYNGEVVSNDYSDYLFVYKVPKSLISHNMLFRYVDGIGYKNGKTYVKAIDVKLNPVNVDNSSINSYEYAVGDSIDIGKSFNGYKVFLNSFDVSDKFVINYNSCVGVGECYDFKEVLIPSIGDNEKVLLKINGNIEFNNSINSINNLYALISKFGSIDYVYNGKNYSESSDFNLINSNRALNNDYFIEVDRDVLYASSIKLSFNFRDSKYSFVLRGDVNA